MLHGPFGEDGTVQGVLELLDVPYVGAGVLASSLCMDKVVFKEVMHAAGVPQVRSVGVREARWRADPAAVRAQLARLGDAGVRQAGAARLLGRHREGVGARPTSTAALEGAFAHDSLVIVEAFSDGLEVECSVIGLDDPEVSVPGRDRAGGGRVVRLRGEVQPRRDGAAGAGRGSPTRWPRRCAAWRGEAFLRVGCAGLARVDFFVEDDRVLVNELNTMPGFTATSVFPKLWEASGLPFAELCDRLLGFALERFERERAGHASSWRAAARRGAISPISTWFAPGGSAVIQTR